MFGHCIMGIACKHAHEDTQCNTHRKEGLWTKAGNGSQSYVLCNEEMHALGGGGSCLGTAPKTELVARATFYTIFALSLKIWTRSGVEAHAWALLASMHCMKTHNETHTGRRGIAAWALLASMHCMKTRNATHTGRRACGQRPEMKARATFYEMFALSLKRCTHSGVGGHVWALRRRQNWSPELRFTQSLPFLCRDGRGRVWKPMRGHCFQACTA